LCKQLGWPLTYLCKQLGWSTAKNSSKQLGCIKRKVSKQLGWPLISANSLAGLLQGTLLNSLAV
jgi:hypothetical protein